MGAWELAVGPGSILVHGRWLNAGYVAGKLFPDEDVGGEFVFSWGVGLKGRYYFSGQLDGFFASFGVEYLRSRVESDSQRVATNAQVLVPQVEAGYRYALGTSFIGGSGSAGYALNVGSEIENIKGGTNADSYEVRDFSTVYGLVSFDLGLFC